MGIWSYWVALRGTETGRELRARGGSHKNSHSSAGSCLVRELLVVEFTTDTGNANLSYLKPPGVKQGFEI